MPITCTPFGQTLAGEPVELYTLSSEAGLTARVATYGGTLVGLLAPDRAGALADVVLGFDRLDGYLGKHPFFGSLVGRFANRIAGGHFSLDGVTHQLAINKGANHLHGGPGGFHRKVWRATVVGDTLGLTYVSPEGEEHYPGRLSVVVTYTVTAANELRIAYGARTTAPTVLNLTNHTYFNLAGAGDILDHELQLEAPHFLPVDEHQIPTGELRPVAGTPMDFTSPRAIGAALGADDEQLRIGGGYDHCWVFDHGGDLGRRVGWARDPRSGRTLELSTTQPGVQFYAMNSVEAPLIGKGDVAYAPHGGFCLETQHFPDSPNRPAFPSTVLRPGETYRHTTVYRFGAE